MTDPGDDKAPERPPEGPTSITTTDETTVYDFGELHARVLDGAVCPICESPTSPWTCSCGCLRLIVPDHLTAEMIDPRRWSA